MKNEKIKLGFIIFAVLLLGFSVVQAIEINDIKDELKQISFAVDSGSTVQVQQYAQQRSAPAMVGGC